MFYKNNIMSLSHNNIIKIKDFQIIENTGISSLFFKLKLLMNIYFR